VNDFPRLLEAFVCDHRRFKRAVSAVLALHRQRRLDPNRAHPLDGKCRECGKPWPCPTWAALDSGLDWDGREGAATAAGEGNGNGH